MNMIFDIEFIHCLVSDVISWFECVCDGIKQGLDDPICDFITVSSISYVYPPFFHIQNIKHYLNALFIYIFQNNEISSDS